jgi:predicted dehydrogenase
MRGPARAVSPLDKLRTAHVGVGGMGAADLGSIASHARVEVAALCDVDRNHLDQARAKFPGAETFADFREMISGLGDKIDAVVVSTPDHTHAPAAMTALNHGLPVYCQKPLTHEVFEARQLRRVAAEKQLVTQMGIQASASTPYRRTTQWIQEGVIGKVSQVHAWSFKNWGYDGGPFAGGPAAPESLDWNLWIGTATMRPYQPGVYHPANWRKIIDFGTGTLGDMGVHIFDTPYRSLQLTSPIWVETSCRPPTGIGHPEKNRVSYEFPGTAHTTQTLSWVWYDGAEAPPSAEELDLPEQIELPDQGSLFVGEKGWLLLPHVAEPILLPAERFRDIQRPTLAPLDHYHQWVDACLGNADTTAHFGYAGPLTEALLLGVVANRFPNQRLTWDAASLRITNLEAANALIRRYYRKNFEVEHL